MEAGCLTAACFKIAQENPSFPRKRESILVTQPLDSRASGNDGFRRATFMLETASVVLL